MEFNVHSFRHHASVRFPSLLLLALSLVACGGGGGGGSKPAASAPPPGPTPDTTAPSVEITSPTTAASYESQSPTLTLAGAASDDDRLASIHWSTDSGSSGVVEGEAAWHIDDIGLAEGTTLVTVTATDASGNRTTDSISVVWAPQMGNSRPSIDGAPVPQVLHGEFYDFLPHAIDPDEDPLQFAIENLPTWALFDPATGRLSGTPAMEDVGSHEDIRVSVSDGLETAALPAFSIDVLDSGLLSISLSWVAPTHRADGSPLTNLGGYHLYYGNGSLEKQIVIENPGLTNWTLGELTAGRYQLAISAFDSNGIEGQQSDVLEIVIGNQE
jgi:hypothetical protein